MPVYPGAPRAADLSGTSVIISQKPVLESFRFGEPPPE
jgi:hypothetical protein